MTVGISKILDYRQTSANFNYKMFAVQKILKIGSDYDNIFSLAIALGLENKLVSLRLNMADRRGLNTTSNPQRLRSAYVGLSTVPVSTISSP